LNNNVFVDVRQGNTERLKLKIGKDDPNRMDTQEIKDILGKNVKYFRFHRQLSQAELAEKADISVTFLSNIERGKMFPKAETLSRLTESLGVEVFELFQTAREDRVEMVNRLSEDITKNVKSAMLEVFAQYLDLAPASK
jgi:transcriptional regulator with XRE-family HTH domain